MRAGARAKVHSHRSPMQGRDDNTLSRSYGILEARDAHDWFLRMMHEHDEFEVETDRVGEPPMPFFSETVRRGVVE